MTDRTELTAILYAYAGALVDECRWYSSCGLERVYLVAAKEKADKAVEGMDLDYTNKDPLVRLYNNLNEIAEASWDCRQMHKKTVVDFQNRITRLANENRALKAELEELKAKTV